MTTLDIVLILILALGIFQGYRQGFLMELFFVLALVLGVFIGFKLMGWGVSLLYQQFNADIVFLPYFSFAIIFVIVVVLVIFIGRRFKDAVDKTFLGKLDAAAGALLGLVKYAFCLSVIFWLMDP